MAALIKKREEIQKVKKAIDIEKKVYEDLLMYCKFIEETDDGISYIMNEALKTIFTKDKEFLDYKKQILSQQKVEES